MSFGDGDSEYNDRESQYETPDFERWRHRKEKKAKDEVRKLSRSIHSHKILSTEWKEQCHALRRLAEIAMDEMSESGDAESGSGCSATVGVGVGVHGATLWDEEAMSMAVGSGSGSGSGSVSVSGSGAKSGGQSVVRLLLEEGKLNLLLRSLSGFKAMDRGEAFSVSLERECNRKKMRMSTLIQLCSIYERSLGILLFFCIRRIESLQILDGEHFVEWIGTMLSRKRVHFKVKSERMDSFFVRSFGEDKRPEVMVLHFLFILSTHFTESQLEEKLMGHIERYHLIHKSIVFVMEHHHVLALDVLRKYTRFLAHCFAAESFSAEPDLFIAAGDDLDGDGHGHGDDEQKEESQSIFTMTLLTEFYTKYAEQFVAQKAIKRKDIRAYSKQYQRFKKLIK